MSVETSNTFHDFVRRRLLDWVAVPEEVPEAVEVDPGTDGSSIGSAEESAPTVSPDDGHLETASPLPQLDPVAFADLPFEAVRIILWELSFGVDSSPSTIQEISDIRDQLASEVTEWNSLLADPTVRLLWALARIPRDLESDIPATAVFGARLWSYLVGTWLVQEHRELALALWHAGLLLDPLDDRSGSGSWRLRLATDAWEQCWFEPEPGSGASTTLQRPSLSLMRRIALVLRQFGFPATGEIRPLKWDSQPELWRPAIAFDIPDWMGLAESDASGNGVSLEAIIGSWVQDGNPGILVNVVGSGTFKLARNPRWQADITAEVSGPGLLVTKAGVDFDGASGAQLGLTVGSTGPTDLISTDELSLTIGSWGLGFSLEAGAGVNGAASAKAFLQDVKFTFNLASADSFIKATVPKKELTATASMELSYHTDTGFRFDGALGARLQLPLNESIGGVLDLSMLTVYLDVGTDGLEVGAAIDFSVHLGPMHATVIEMGTHLEVGWGGNTPSFEWGFKAPSGIGLSIKAPGVSGGGLILLRPELGQYDGIFQLAIDGLGGVNALALIDTRVPGDADAWSFLGVLSLTLGGTGIPLGFGFNLLAVGGMFGYNRGIDTSAMVALYDSGNMWDLFFPEDAIKNAAKILPQVRSAFPVEKGTFVIGPAIKIGFGYPNLLTASLAVLVPIPALAPIVILGSLELALPTKELAIVEINIDILGLLDVPEKTFLLFGRLRDSRVLAFKLEGEMAFLLRWGDRPEFCLSIGGFHPAFTPPAGLRQLERLSSGYDFGIARMEMAQYFAISSNSFQCGAEVQVYAGISGFSVHLWAGFDALIYFRPFQFLVDFRAGVRVSCAGLNVGLEIDGHLSGPSPYHLWGKIKISLLFWDVKIPVDLTFGEKKVEVLEDTQTPGEVLRGELVQVDRWSTASRLSSVILDNTAGLIDPAGGLRFSQKKVPLNREITRFDNQDVTPPVKLGLTMRDVEGEVQDESEWIAPGAYLKLTDAQRIAQPSFEKVVAGASWDPAGTGGSEVSFTVDFEPLSSDDRPPQRLLTVRPAALPVVGRIKSLSATKATKVA